jgi:hypothetical protein
MTRVWLIASVLFYPLTLAVSFWLLFYANRRDQLSALASGLIVFLILWLYALPRDLVWDFGPIAWESRFVLPLTAYLCGLAVAALLMSWTRRPGP